jgi:hypothetical protein
VISTAILNCLVHNLQPGQQTPRVSKWVDGH